MSADPNPNNTGSSPQGIQLGGPDHVGVYTCPDAKCDKTDGLTLSPGEFISADCWVSGGNVGNAGDVWYRTEYVAAAEFRSVPGLPHCPS